MQWQAAAEADTQISIHGSELCNNRTSDHIVTTDTDTSLTVNLNQEWKLTILHSPVFSQTIIHQIHKYLIATSDEP